MYTKVIYFQTVPKH